MNDQWLEIGEIVAPQGLKGELRVKNSSDFPERFTQLGKRWLQRPQESVPEVVELVSSYPIPGKNIYVVKLAQVSDRTAAENLKGAKLLVDKSDRPELGVDEYHVPDLINLSVYHQIDGTKIGIVTAVLFLGNDLLEVTLEGKENKVLIPFVKEIVPVVDLETQRIEINPPVGLLEL
ncbi:MAG: ribosome maturation factor RimM [Gloeocapsa sp. DLM2.Bin57]|nr:MAG: ribosome maturation factor RimM [Gloeocapsa sp. DLM2.Bin57]